MDFGVGAGIVRRLLGELAEARRVGHGAGEVAILGEIAVEVNFAEVAFCFLVAGHVALEVGDYVVAPFVMLGGEIGQEVKEKPKLRAGIGLDKHHFLTV